MNYKDKAREHQSDFFEKNNQSKNNNKKGRAQNHWLNEECASKGKNFYPDSKYDIFTSVEGWRGDKKNTPEWFMDTLRSQHIPFNFFVPLMKEKALCIKVFSELLNIDIIKIIDIKIEYPPVYKNSLDDKTSFDAFISYETSSGKGILGIEVKYTERGYSLSKSEREKFPKKLITYRRITKESELYKNPKEEKLIKNKYRQIWRNHLLTYDYAKKNKYDEYISLTLYPKGNTHFISAMKEYDAFLNDKEKPTLKGITYEDFFDALIANSKTDEQKRWIKYLINRYIVSDKNILLNKLEKAVK